MPHATRPGDVLGGRYRLVDLLTESDGGRFWRAYDPVLERHVAIHVIRGDDERAPALMEAARRSATVPDQRVLRVLDADCTDDECYVVNEWGWGTSLDIVVAGGVTLGARRASWLVAEVAESMAAAHAVGVAHGRLNPENVLIDRAGGVRIIGLCVDAALHGVADLPDDPVQHDLDDLAGLLYCALTARWAGPSGSIVVDAPRSHGEVLRPRQVRAGIPRPLDQVCDEVLHRAGRHRELGEAVSTARGLSEHLRDFVGDPNGMAEALLTGVPDVLPDEEQVVLPPVPEIEPHDAEPQPEPEPEPDPAPESARRRTDDRPTEAGVPIFGDDIDDVSWLERRPDPAPPPPPFEAPPERPLFAPPPTGGEPQRTPRENARPSQAQRDDDGFWPWDTGGSGALPAVGETGETGETGALDTVPGRGFLRLATLLALVALVGLAVVVAINLRSRESDATPPPVRPSAEAPLQRAAASTAPLRGLVATAYDPLGDPPAENDAAAPLAVDGDPSTAWTTQSYVDQLGTPRSVKSGVGLLVDLDGSRTVDQVVLTLGGTPTSVSLYVTGTRPTLAPDAIGRREPVAQGTADGARLVLDTGGVRGTHLVVWLTSLPLDDGARFRGTIAEVLVRGE